MDLGKRIKILFVTLLLLLVSITPGAMENSFVLVDKLVPNNIRLTNSFSSGSEFSGVEKTVSAFLRKWSIEGASLAIAKDGKLIFAGDLDNAKMHQRLKLSHIAHSELQVFQSWLQLLV